MRVALRQMPTIPRCEHDVTTTRPRPFTLTIRVCSPRKSSGTIAPSRSTRRFSGMGSKGSASCISPLSSTPSASRVGVRTVSTRTS